LFSGKSHAFIEPMPSEILFEVTQIGAYVKITAVDPQTGIEASVTGPASLSPHQLQQAAIRKLQYVLEKKKRK